MSLSRKLLLRMFGRPRGLLGRLGGIIMSRTNRRHAAWAIGLLDVQPDNRVLEVGCGPGAAIQVLAGSAQQTVGIDPSAEMLGQARQRNAAAIATGRIDLQQASADRLPYADGSFDMALAINSMQVWPDAMAGLQEIRRVIKSGGRVALAFTVHSGQRSEGVPDTVSAAGFVDCRLVQTNAAFCVLATRR
jgi:ubiquinone/menaquinone biosynthesis C-methylase UbiE